MSPPSDKTDDIPEINFHLDNKAMKKLRHQERNTPVSAVKTQAELPPPSTKSGVPVSVHTGEMSTKNAEADQTFVSEENEYGIVDRHKQKNKKKHMGIAEKRL